MYDKFTVRTISCVVCVCEVIHRAMPTMGVIVLPWGQLLHALVGGQRVCEFHPVCHAVAEDRSAGNVHHVLLCWHSSISSVDTPGRSLYGPMPCCCTCVLCLCVCWCIPVPEVLLHKGSQLCVLNIHCNIMHV